MIEYLVVWGGAVLLYLFGVQVARWVIHRYP